MGWEEVLFAAIAGPPTILALVLLVDILRDLGTLPRLQETPTERAGEWPAVSIVTPACDEEGSVESALRSMLAQDYPELEVVAVDDRSTDRTGEIIDALADEDGRLAAVHVTDLPEGWLGKVNALAKGVGRASGDWLLFADADVALAPTALRKAVAYAEREDLDLLTVVPTIRSAGLVGDAFFSFALMLLSGGGRLKKVRDGSSKSVAATGAFILVRRAAYERTPGFEWIRLEVSDDFGLCLLLKEHGGRCEIVNGRSEVSITWYASFPEMVRAMQKNFFAIMGRFSMLRTTLQASVFAWLSLFPAAALMPVEPPWLRLVPVLGVACLVAAAMAGSILTARPIRGALILPVGILATAFMVLRSGIVGRRLGGITWRGVLYSSEQLRPEQKVGI